MAHYRDMPRTDLMAVGVEHIDSRNQTPLLWHGVEHGDENTTGLRASNIGCLFADARLLGGRHVINYRLSWFTDNGQDELTLGDAVDYELAVAMYQELLYLITNAHPSSTYIRRTLLELEI